MINANPRFTVSVQENTNKIIGSSEEKFSGIRPGSLIKINNDNTLYTILNQESLLFIKHFKVKDGRTIIIDEDSGVNLQHGDELTISYKEYELLMVLDIIEKGQGYDVDSDINIDGGQVNIDISTGFGNGTILTVKEVDSEGGITKLAIKNKGKYLIAPENPVKILSNNGRGAILDVKYKEINNRNLIERQVVHLNSKDGKTTIMLNYSLPINLTEGKISVEKSHLLITPNYIGNTQLNVSYQIFQDFTPHCHIPLMSKGTLSPEIIYNKGSFIVDNKITQIENEINQLKSEIKSLKDNKK